MDYLLICGAALAASALTLFSGFGLGTLLMPVFALFFPLSSAVAMTAVVHLLNNLFKFALLGRHADWKIVVRFGVPAIAAAIVGAWVLELLSGMAPLHEYTLAGRAAAITPVKLVLAVLMAVFAVSDLYSSHNQRPLDRRLLPLGGAASGFLGGLSGHQGALRAAFLIRLGLSKEAYIATGVVIACLVDAGRMIVYLTGFWRYGFGDRPALLGAATLAAFAGAFAGSRLLSKVTVRFVQVLVAVMLLLIALLLGVGVI